MKRWRTVSYVVVSSVYALAAAGKTYDIIMGTDTAVAGVLFFAGDRFFLLPVVAGEYAVVILMCFRRTRMFATRCALVLTLAFGAIASLRALRGDRSPCGCFGARVALSPWMELLLVGILLVFLSSLLSPKIGDGKSSCAT